MTLRDGPAPVVTVRDVGPHAGSLVNPHTVPFARNLVAHGERTALITAEGDLTYRELAARVQATARRLRGARRLVMLVGSNAVDTVVTYLAALSAGHPLLLVPGDHPRSVSSLVATYDPDIVIEPSAAGGRIDERCTRSAHLLHPDLALLLSTSGSTGSPKLVRLSHENLQSNAEAIAEYLHIRDTDRAATSLPMSYCYGLSVINSHLLRGAGLILTDLSVTDPGFWHLFQRHHGTSFAGVPYTFDLLDRIGFAAMRLPQLRYVTQAGGRLAPERVARYAALGRRRGFDFFVMYGQTEATARMAYLPPDLAECRPSCIGRPIAGGSFRLRPVPEHPGPDTGELIYAGPNVMLGYAEDPTDLRLGRTIEELPTGDIGRHSADGLIELVGRRSEFAKILGVRVDPGQVDAMLAEHGVTSASVGRNDELVVAVTAAVDVAQVRRLVSATAGLPARCVRVHAVADLPRLASGKLDYAAIRALRTTPEPTTPGTRAQPAPPYPLDDLCRLYARVLDRSDVAPHSSFVSLGGDSLSYVEMSIKLEQALGRLPDDWHTTAIRDLRPREVTSPRKVRLDTSVALRAISIILIVGTHAQLFAISGGAHLLLAVAGFNLGRFHLTDTARPERVRAIARSLGRIVCLSVAWIALVFLLTDDYALHHVLLLHYVLGPDGVNNDYWFIEALAYIVVFVMALLAIPIVDRTERRFPFALPMALVGIGLITRYQLIPGVHVRTPAETFWLFALGWAVAKASDTKRRLLVTLAGAITIPGFFAALPREAVILAGLVLLVWLPALPATQTINTVAGWLASGSLLIYLTHWQVFPRLDQFSNLLAVLASLAAGVALAVLLRTAWPRAKRLGGVVRRRRDADRGSPAPAGGV